LTRASKLEHVSNENDGPAAEEVSADKPNGGGLSAEESIDETKAKKRRRSTAGTTKLSLVLGIFGEVLITIGAVVLLFLVWQLYINNAVLAREQVGLTQEQSLAWATVTPTPSATNEPEQTDFGPPPAMAPVSEGEQFGILYIPRLGPDSQRAVRHGVDPASVLNHGYYGHYPDTQMPGEPGNFAMAIHRTGWGSSFADVPKLQAGDKIYLETADGYYTYTFRNYEFVLPTAVDVVLPVPGSNAPATDQMLITITTCNPLLGDAERLISYGVYESWRPRSAGPPPAIAAIVTKEAN
jgi:sortase A